MKENTLVEKIGKDNLSIKKEFAKKGLVVSSSLTVATAFFTKNETVKKINILAAASTIGFGAWSYFLNNPKKINKKTQITKESLKPLSSENLAINLNNFYLELSIKGKLTKEEFKAFEEKIESLLEIYSVPKMNILLDIREIEGIEFKSLWDDLLFTIRHFEEIERICVIGNTKLEEYTIGIANKLSSKELHYYKNYEDAHKCLMH